MNIEEKEKHNDSFYDKKKLYKSIINRNNDYIIIKALKHDFPKNDTVLDNETGNYFIYLILKYKNFSIIKKYDNV